MMKTMKQADKVGGGREAEGVAGYVKYKNEKWSL